MSFDGSWPYTPTKLSDHIEEDTISLLLSAICARQDRPITILDFDQATNTFIRIEPLSEVGHYADFCANFRNDRYVEGGNEACAKCDLDRARQAILAWRQNPDQPVQSYRCHMGLTDYTAVIDIEGHPVGVLFTGQVTTPDRIPIIAINVNKIAENKRNTISFQDATIRELLLDNIDQIPQDRETLPREIDEEIGLIKGFAENYYRANKRQRELAFLDDLRNERDFSQVNTLQEIRVETARLLEQIRAFCHARYAVFYTNVGVNDNVLTPIAEAGLPHSGELPHLNWRKAGLKETYSKSLSQLILGDDRPFKNGIRGNNTELFRNAAGMVTLMLGQTYRSALVFGEFDQAVDLNRERSFLFQINRIMGWTVSTKLQQLRLRDEDERQTTVRSLLQHRFRTALTPIATQIGIAKRYFNKNAPSHIPLIEASIKAAHSLSLQLGKTSSETVRSTDVMVEKEDLRFEWFPLSVLVTNSVDGFAEPAREKGRNLKIDSSIEQLPYGEVDIGRLSIAFSNLMENALKYSYPGTQVTVWADTGLHFSDTLGSRSVDVVVENFGDSIPQDKIDKYIFEKGKRGLVGAKMGKLEGTGYGLWETRAIIEAHGGEIKATCEKTRRQHSIGTVYQVTFTLRIPLSQEKR